MTESGDHEKLARAWQTAAQDLGIRVTSPYPLERPGSRTHSYAALVHEFGAVRGMLVDTCERIVAPPPEYGYSGMSAAYGTYERARFIEALKDWGWASAGAPPSWYATDPAPAV